MLNFCSHSQIFLMVDGYNMEHLIYYQSQVLLCSRRLDIYFGRGVGGGGKDAYSLTIAA